MSSDDDDVKRYVATLENLIVSRDAELEKLRQQAELQNEVMQTHAEIVWAKDEYIAEMEAELKECEAVIGERDREMYALRRERNELRDRYHQAATALMQCHMELLRHRQPLREITVPKDRENIPPRITGKLADRELDDKEEEDA